MILNYLKPSPGLEYVGYDERVHWSPSPVQADPCTVCKCTEHTLSGTCLRCMRIRQATELFYSICLVVGGVLWASMDDSTKRFMMMEMR